MIRVDKQRRDTSCQIIMPTQAWFDNAAAAQALANVAKGAREYIFRNDVYGADIVRVALGELFFDKCGYCEYKLARTDLNIDHYRPKGRVAEARNHPGYYWLAYDWSNLIPACTPCNQRRRELPKWPATSRAPSAGKSDSFPLLHETRRAWSPQANITLEEPLLLNPTTDVPSEHLTFHPDGTAFHLTNKGKTSIRIYNLNARQLNEMRRCVIKEVVELLKLKREMESFTSEPKAPEGSKIIQAMIMCKTHSSAQYAAVARAVVKKPIAFGL